MIRKIINYLTTAEFDGFTIVIGPPRSGTSLLANIISEGGIRFGNNLRKGDDGNVDGYMEDKALHQANLALYRFMTEHRNPSDHGHVIGRNYFDRLIECLLIYRVKQRVKYLHKNNYFEQGIKSPAMCVTFRRLYRLFKNPKLIYIVRHPAEMIASAAISGGSSPTKTLELWKESVINILIYKDKFGGDLILHERLINKEKKTLETIKRHWIGDYDDSIFDIIKQDQYRYRNNNPVPEYIERLWDHVKTIAV